MKLRAPAIPIITIDPYFSVWAKDERLNAAATMHWTEASNSIIGTVSVDQKVYSFLGYQRDLHKMEQTSLDITPLSTTASFRSEEIALSLRLTSALLPDDFDIMTRPVSYLAVTYQILDGKKHDVKIKISLSEELCLDHAKDHPVTIEQADLGKGLCGFRMGNAEQKPLNRSGDDLRIDWGYVYLAVRAESAEIGPDPLPKLRTQHVMVQVPAKEAEEVLFLFAYDDCGSSIEYFHETLRSYWNRDGKSIETAIREAAADYSATLARCSDFDRKLLKEANRVGGSKYADLLTLAYRQVIAAHKLVLDKNGEILFISKECFSNGCAATVDVSYPSIPMFLYFAPELVKGMIRPVCRYARSEGWIYDFAPHDVGQYPLVNGQVYHGNALRYQMPVEECGNMLIMEANVALATGSADFAAEHMELLEAWYQYLLKYGADPDEQLCTDDFAGHLAHNCNLSLKAIMGIEGMSILKRMLGCTEEAEICHLKAKEMAENWLKNAANSDGSTRLAFDQPGTYSMKYNMVWDKIWGSGLFSQEFRDEELRHNREHFQTYGMPLDSRADYTKSDWYIWTASMAGTKADFCSFIAPLWKAYHVSPSRVPLTDWFDTKTSREVTMHHRSVQGGLFMRLLADGKWIKK